MRRIHIHAMLLLLVLLAGPCIGADDTAQAWQTTDEAWYALELAGSRAGWMHLLEEKAGEMYRTTSRTHLEIGRANSSITATITSSFVEREDDTPVRLDYTQDMSTQTVETSMVFEDDGIVYKAKQGAHATEKRLPPFEQDWRTPRQAARQFEQALETGTTSLNYHTLDGSSGTELVEVTQERIGVETVEIDGESQPVTVWKTTMSILPMPATERYDASGELVTQEINLGFGSMTVRRCSRAEAMQAPAGGAPELLVSTFVTPDKPIGRIDQVERLELRLRMTESEMIDLPSAGAQHVTLGGDGQSALVTIDLNRAGEDRQAEQPDDFDEFLESSILINAKDDAIVELAERAARWADGHPMSKAEAMRRFVHRYINRKGLEVAFASAAETARQRRGDCSEHAVLLCAMLRSHEIPARVAIGLLYVDQFAGKRDSFGWHMWTQAWIDGRWVDLDATLRRAYHAGHIMTGASSLSDGIADADFTSLMMLMGRLEIDVVKVQYAGDREPSPAR